MENYERIRPINHMDLRNIDKNTILYVNRTYHAKVDCNGHTENGYVFREGNYYIVKEILLDWRRIGATSYIIYLQKLDIETKEETDIYLRFEMLIDDFKSIFALWYGKKTTKKCHDLNPIKVIFNNPATIVLWEDGTKTVVKAQDGEFFDQEKGLALCFMKKALGNQGNYNNMFKKYIKDDAVNLKVFNDIIVNAKPFLDFMFSNIKKDQ